MLLYYYAVIQILYLFYFLTIKNWENKELKEKKELYTVLIYKYEYIYIIILNYSMNWQ